MPQRPRWSFMVTISLITVRVPVRICIRKNRAEIGHAQFVIDACHQIRVVKNQASIQRS